MGISYPYYATGESLEPIQVGWGMWNTPYPASSMETSAVLDLLDRIEKTEGAHRRHHMEHNINIFGGAHRLVSSFDQKEPEDPVEDARLARAYQAVLERVNVVWAQVVEGQSIGDLAQFRADAGEAYALACEGSDLRWGSPLGED